MGERTIDTGTGETITADAVVIAAGARPVIPDIDGLEVVGYHTSDTVMRLDALPQRLLIVGGGFVAAEFAHVFGSFGTQVTIANRSSALLREEDAEISATFTAIARRRWDVRLDTTVTRLEADGDGARAHLSDGSTLDVDVVLVATGRRSNADALDLDRAGVTVDEQDVVVVDEHQRTSAPGIWALGDVANHFQLKHVSNLEARVIQADGAEVSEDAQAAPLPWCWKNRAVSLTDPPSTHVTPPSVRASPARRWLARPSTASSRRLEGTEEMVMAADSAGILYRARLEVLATSAAGDLASPTSRSSPTIRGAPEPQRRWMFSICRERGIPLPLCNHRIEVAGRTFIADFCWPARD